MLRVGGVSRYIGRAVEDGGEEEGKQHGGPACSVVWLLCFFFFYPLRPPTTRRGRYQVTPRDVATKIVTWPGSALGETFGFGFLVGFFLFLRAQDPSGGPVREEPSGGSQAGLWPTLSVHKREGVSIPLNPVLP